MIKYKVLVNMNGRLYAPGEYDFDNLEAVTAYLNTFELPEGAGDHSFLSPRRAVPIRVIYIKKGKEEIKNE